MSHVVIVLISELMTLFILTTICRGISRKGSLKQDLIAWGTLTLMRKVFLLACLALQLPVLADCVEVSHYVISCAVLSCGAYQLWDYVVERCSQTWLKQDLAGIIGHFTNSSLCRACL